MESLIREIKNSLSRGLTQDQIDDIIIKFGISEYNFFLGYKAAELLLKYEKEEREP